jgi:hypothetical protein
LVDKEAGKLSTWNGRNLSHAGRACLTKVVLTSQPVYLLTVIKPPKEVFKDIDKIRRRFLWAGDKALSGGKCKVNWTKTTLPRDLGGLGLLNLEKFARALRLRWLWQEWTATDKAWVRTEVPCDDTDRRLFARCTRILLGNGKKATFWLATRKTTQGLGASTLRQIPKEETQGCGGPAERQLDPGSKPPFRLHYGSLLGIHHVVDPHRGD